MRWQFVGESPSTCSCENVAIYEIAACHNPDGVSNTFCLGIRPEGILLSLGESSSLDDGAATAVASSSVRSNF
jgi:hypothetical protein